MNNEIKEILNNIGNKENYSNFIDSQYGGKDYYYLLEKEESKKLLDYITNLQEENKRLNNQYDLMENSLDEKQEIIDKAIEYMEQCRDTKTKRIDSRLKRVLNILEGSDKE